MWINTLTNSGLRDVRWAAYSSYYLADRAVFCYAIKMHLRHHQTPHKVDQFFLFAPSRRSVTWFALIELQEKTVHTYLGHTYSAANNNNDVSSMCFLWGGYLPYHIERFSIENTASKETNPYGTNPIIRGQTLRLYKVSGWIAGVEIRCISTSQSARLNRQ